MWAAVAKHVELGQHVSVKVSYLAPPPSHSRGAESGCTALTSHVEAAEEATAGKKLHGVSWNLADTAGPGRCEGRLLALPLQEFYPSPQL